MFWEYELMLDTGVTVNYWALVSMYTNLQTAEAHVSYYGYLDQAAYNAGKEKIIERSAAISFAEIDPNGDMGLLVRNKVIAVQAAEAVA